MCHFHSRIQLSIRYFISLVCKPLALDCLYPKLTFWTTRRTGQQYSTMASIVSSYSISESLHTLQRRPLALICQSILALEVHRHAKSDHSVHELQRNRGPHSRQVGLFPRSVHFPNDRQTDTDKGEDSQANLASGRWCFR